jgi:hypothetical protein
LNTLLLLVVAVAAGTLGVAEAQVGIVAPCLVKILAGVRLLNLLCLWFRERYIQSR